MPVPRCRGVGSRRIPPRWLNADHPRVRLTPDLDEPWLLEFDRRRHEIFMNSAAFGLTDVW